MAKPQYRHAHQQERKRWEPVVAAGEAYCVEPICKMPTRWIPPGSRWHLGHTPDGTRWTGPTHVRCNTSEGAARGNRMRRRKPAARRPSRPPTDGRWAL